MGNFFVVALEIIGIGAVGSLICQKDKELSHLISSVSSFIGALLVLIFSINLLLSGVTLVTNIPTSFPLFTLSFRIDPLAAFFLFIIAIIALPASVYGIGYMKSYYKKYNIGMFGFFYNLFLISLLLVVTSYNGLYFLFVWELMSLSSLFLVLFEHREADTIKAGITYFIMTHIGTAFIFVSFLFLYQSTGSFDFGLIKLHSETIPVIARNSILFCMIIGFGTKAGIIPLHIWLPKAHGAAPSHVSALMSGVMIKMGIFMFVRMFFDILPQPTIWLGFTILIVGAVSSLLGVLYALSEHDSKKLLAYHSIENIGIILLGLGSGLVFISMHKPELATLAIIAGLFHTINHAVFKSLLFLGAGSVISQTHTRNIEEYGGLIKRMPYTALFFLIGAIAISGLPPFNGFVSEWLTFQSLFAGIATQSMLTKSLFIFAGASLAFTGGLAAACFVKAFGITFLARPRSAESEKAKESSPLFTLSMGFLAALCLLLGIFAATVVQYLQVVVGSLQGLKNQSSVLSTINTTLHVTQGAAALNIPILLLGLIFSLMVVFGLVYLVSHKQKTTLNDLWACGYGKFPGPRNEITATAFSRTLIVIFKGIFQPTKQHTVEYVDANMRYFSKSRTVTLTIVNVYEKHLYSPLHNGIDALSLQIKKIQGGNVNQYLLYIFIVLLGLLIWVRY
ncbi:MAG TPA: hydrogenase 4 subunit B [Candidatus Saccharimonadales bacterium]|nr:hydrogenase 4 subunit B [Candidatus Saccharimonadales bacterium]